MVAMEARNESDFPAVCQYANICANVSSVANVAQSQVHGSFGRLIQNQVIPSICLFGTLGNIFNLFVLLPRIIRRHDNLSRMEKYSYAGLVALAVSDLSFCVFVGLKVFTHDFSRPYISCIFDFDAFYFAYNNAVVNTFTMSSTWLTVTLAAGRYFAISNPIKSRKWMGMSAFKLTLLVVISCCVGLNIPRIWTVNVSHVTCADGVKFYKFSKGYLKKNATFDAVYNWFYFIIGILFPLALLTYFNTFLIRALNRMRDTRTSIRASDSQENMRHITITFIGIVVMFIVLVTPSEIIVFVFRYLDGTDPSTVNIYNLVTDVFNTFQTLNFSMNFVLYCVINATFRKSVVQAFCCIACRKQEDVTLRMRGSQYTSVTLETSMNDNFTNGRRKHMSGHMIVCSKPQVTLELETKLAGTQHESVSLA